jgi:hypothetical protein
VSGQLRYDRGECVGEVGAEGEVGEADSTSSTPGSVTGPVINPVPAVGERPAVLAHRSALDPMPILRRATLRQRVPTAPKAIPDPLASPSCWARWPSSSWSASSASGFCAR